MSAEPMDFWKKLEKEPFTRPTLKKLKIFSDIPDEGSDKVCALYVVDEKGEEFAVLIDQARLDRISKAGTSHVRAMKVLLAKLKRKEDTAKFTFLAGYYLEKGIIKINSCANFGRRDDCGMGEGTQGMVREFLKYLEATDPDLYKKLRVKK